MDIIAVGLLSTISVGSLYYLYKKYNEYKELNDLKVILDNTINATNNLLDALKTQSEYINTVNMINLDVKITYTSDILNHDNKKILEIDSFSDNDSILEFIKNNGEDITNIEYRLIDRFLNEKIDTISLFRNIYLANKGCNIQFLIINKSQEKGDIVFTYSERLSQTF